MSTASITAPVPRAFAARAVIAGLVIAVVAWVAILGVLTGQTVDPDAGSIIRVFNRVLDGGYEVSRTTGFPLYEIGLAPVYGVAGKAGVMVMSLVFTVGGLLLLLPATRALASWVGLACWAFLALGPLVLSNASAIMETSLLFGVIGLVAWLLSRTARTGWRQGLPWLLVTLALVLTRPDSGLLALATGLAFLAATSLSWRTRWWSFGAIGVGGALALGVVWLLAQEPPIGSRLLLDATPFERIVRGAVGTVTVFSPIGALALGLFVVLAVVALIRWRTTAPSADSTHVALDDQRFLIVWLLATTALYGFRYTMLPDELEYLVPLLVVVAVVVPRLWLARQDRVMATVGLVALGGVASTSIVAFSFFQRVDPWQYYPSIRPAVSIGGTIQDLQLRQAYAARGSAEYQEWLDASLGELAADVSSGEAALMTRDDRHVALNDPSFPTTRDASVLVGCEALTTRIGQTRWRLSQPAGEYGDVPLFESGIPTSCAVVAILEPETLTVTEAGATDGTPAGTVVPRYRER